MNILSVLHCEIRKIIRSNVFWIMFLVLGFGPIMMGVGNVLSSDAGGVSWEQYLTGLLDTLAPLGLIGYTFVAAWVFGREFADRTIKDLLAKPVSRAKIVLSKFLVILAWCLLLSVYMFAVGFAVGAIMGAQGGSASFISSLFFKFLITSLLYIFVTAPTILLANVTKGYLAPLGLILIIVILSNVLASFGFAPYFPWTIPSVFQSTGSLHLSSILILAYTGIIGIAGTFAWWRYAEQP
ncbi:MULTISPECIES: ABC transporter permease [Paenibacillus]|jgi:ABC-2 type transport system permease protein|uniref:ABC transporter permease n=1 Tax=Paenibacillus TaxID=44249 RepID=UPI00096C5893|nr:ABC transporter permease [Paenibacillus sp. FSL H8-0259]OMF22787.1 bacitracin ABC transporter permease [Paenibacillus sp. FSL H8-0259]